MTATTRFRPEKPFLPHRPARSGAVQTALARTRPKAIDQFTRAEQPILLDAGPDMTDMDPGRNVRLLGYYSRTPAIDRRGLVMTLHGWEGCSHSNYNLVLGSSLLKAGYDVFRLNLRDHGPGYHADPYQLNKGIFLGSLIDEAAAATHRVAEMAGDTPFFIVGASMGGNFALRLAAGTASSLSTTCSAWWPSARPSTRHRPPENWTPTHCLPALLPQALDRIPARQASPLSGTLRLLRYRYERIGLRDHRPSDPQIRLVRQRRRLLQDLHR